MVTVGSFVQQMADAVEAGTPQSEPSRMISISTRSGCCLVCPDES